MHYRGVLGRSLMARKSNKNSRKLKLTLFICTISPLFFLFFFKYFLMFNRTVGLASRRGLFHWLKSSSRVQTRLLIHKHNVCLYSFFFFNHIGLSNATFLICNCVLNWIVADTSLIC